MTIPYYKHVDPLVICYSLLLNMAIEIDGLPMNKMVDLSSSLCKRLPEGQWDYHL